MRSAHRAILAAGACVAMVGGSLLATTPAFADEGHPPLAVVNVVPTGNGQALVTTQDTALGIHLTGYDPDGGTLTYAVLNGPEHGTLSGAGANLVYHPASGYHGSDVLTFVVNDGTSTSVPAAVTITVLAPPPPAPVPPVALGQSVTTLRNHWVPITLTGADAGHHALEYAVATDPAHGSLTGHGARLAYTPDEDFVGTDSFTFTVWNGTLRSSRATVTVVVRPAHRRYNLPPVALSQVTRTVENRAIRIKLRGFDPEGHAIRFAAAQPLRGTLTGTGATRIYTPDRNFSGTDRFVFRVSDGRQRSALATVTVLVRPIAYLPIAGAQSVTTEAGHSIRIRLTGYSADGGPLAYQIRDEPDHGTLTVEGRTVIYRPHRGFTGRDDFTFTVARGPIRSAQAKVSILVVPKA